MSSDDLEKRSTSFSSRSARFQLEITYLVVKNVISSWKRVRRLEKVVEHFSKSSDDIQQENLRIWHTNLDYIRRIWGYIDWNAQKYRNEAPSCQLVHW